MCIEVPVCTAELVMSCSAVLYKLTLNQLCSWSGSILVWHSAQRQLPDTCTLKIGFCLFGKRLLLKMMMKLATRIIHLVLQAASGRGL